ncbi:hypothetical protein [Ancylobacter aquaticus]|nr:hypothetical protein [Ancylobacter aquaticus]
MFHDLVLQPLVQAPLPKALIVPVDSYGALPARHDVDAALRTCG